MISSQSLFNEKQIIALAEAASDYANSIILKSSTMKNSSSIYVANNVRFLDDAIGDIREYVRQLTAAYHKLEPNRYLAHFDATLDICKKFSIGNCYEYACTALMYLYQGNYNVSAELFKLPNKDHVFLVLNRDKNSDPKNPLTWGFNCVVCDPFQREKSDRVYLSQEYFNKNLHHHIPDLQYFNMNLLHGDFYESDLEVDSYERPPAITLDYIKNTRSSQLLIEIFEKQIEKNIDLIKNYVTEINDECKNFITSAIGLSNIQNASIENQLMLLSRYYSSYQAKLQIWANDQITAAKDIIHKNEISITSETEYNLYIKLRTLLLSNMLELKKQRYQILKLSEEILNNTQTCTPFFKKISIPTLLHQQLLIIMQEFENIVNPKPKPGYSYVKAYADFDLQYQDYSLAPKPKMSD